MMFEGLHLSRCVASLAGGGQASGQYSLYGSDGDPRVDAAR